MASALSIDRLRIRRVAPLLGLSAWILVATTWVIQRALGRLEDLPVWKAFAPGGVEGLLLGCFGAQAIVGGWLVHRRRPGIHPILWPAATLLMLLSAAFLWRIGPSVAVNLREAHYVHLVRMHLLWANAALGLMALLALGLRGSHLRWLSHHGHVLALLAAGALIATALFGEARNGKRLWLPLGPFSLQTVEVVKVLLVVFLAAHLAERRVVWDRPQRSAWRPPPLSHLGPLAMLVALTLSPLVLQRDLGPALLLSAVALVLFGLGTRNAIMPILGVALLVGGAWLSVRVGEPPVVQARVLAWLDPYHRSEQLAHSLWATAAGGLWGTGLGWGSPQLIPVVYSDFILAGWAEETGFLGTASVLVLLLGLALAGFQIAMRQGEPFRALLAAGLGLVLGFQSLLIAGGIWGLLPLTGITVPLFSYGGSGLLINGVMVGMLLNLSGTATAPRSPRPWRVGSAILIGGWAVLLGRLASVQMLTPEEHTDTPFHDKRRHGRIAEAFDDGTLAFNENGIIGAAPRSIRREAQSLASRGLLRETGTSWEPASTAYTIHNPRRRGDARAPVRGAILDREGNPLAWSEWRRGRERRHTSPEPMWQPLVGVIHPVFGTRGLEEWAAPLITTSNVGPFREALSPIESSRSHDSVLTTLDTDLQGAVWNALEGHRGSAVFLDPRTGEILACVSHPSLPADAPLQNWRAALDDPIDSPLRHRALQHHLPPGSTIKPIIADAALEARLIRTTTPLVCAGSWRPWRHASFRIRDYETHILSDWDGHSPRGNSDFTLREAIAKSCNVTFCQLATRLGSEELVQAAAQRHFFDPIPIRFGSIPRADLVAPSRLWPESIDPNDLTPTHLAQTGIGQLDVRVTVLQQALLAASIANGGVAMTPQLIHARRDALGRVSEISDPVPLGEWFAPERAAFLREAMVLAVEQGTGRNCQIEGVTVAGKTGSAQRADGQVDAWFIGFAPAENPRLAWAIAIEGAGTGGRNAAPRVREVLEANLSLLGVEAAPAEIALQSEEN